MTPSVPGTAGRRTVELLMNAKQGNVWEHATEEQFVALPRSLQVKTVGLGAEI
jgi:hypothetical protein